MDTPTMPIRSGAGEFEGVRQALDEFLYARLRYSDSLGQRILLPNHNFRGGCEFVAAVYVLSFLNRAVRESDLTLLAIAVKYGVHIRVNRTRGVWVIKKHRRGSGDSYLSCTDAL